MSDVRRLQRSRHDGGRVGRARPARARLVDEPAQAPAQVATSPQQHGRDRDPHELRGPLVRLPSAASSTIRARRGTGTDTADHTACSSSGWRLTSSAALSIRRESESSSNGAVGEVELCATLHASSAIASTTSSNVPDVTCSLTSRKLSNRSRAFSLTSAGERLANTCHGSVGEIGVASAGRPARATAHAHLALARTGTAWARDVEIPGSPWSHEERSASWAACFMSRTVRGGGRGSALPGLSSGRRVSRAGVPGRSRHDGLRRARRGQARTVHQRGQLTRPAGPASPRPCVGFSSSHRVSSLTYA